MVSVLNLGRLAPLEFVIKTIGIVPKQTAKARSVGRSFRGLAPGRQAFREEPDGLFSGYFLFVPEAIH
jgi:hypothetical protein